MAKFQHGIIFTGKLGPLVGASWRGINYVRTAPKKSHKRPTPEQAAHRQRLALTTKIILGMIEAIDIGYRIEAKQQSPFNMGISMMFQNKVVTGQDAELKADYSKMIISVGKLGMIANPVIRQSGSDIVFNWEYGDQMRARRHDLVVLTAYCEELDECEISVGPAFRESFTASLPVRSWAGKLVHTWLFFISADQKQISNSQYAGELLLSVED